MKLSQKTCVPCEGSVPPMPKQKVQDLLGQLQGWSAVRNHHLEKEFAFANFQKALNFTNKVGSIAEEQGHHPDIFLAWGKVKLTIWTHKINGLTESDFIFAAKIDKINKA